MPRVVFTAHLRRHVSCPEVEVSARSVADALEEAFKASPQIRGYVLDEQGHVRQHISIYVDGQRIADRERMSDPVAERSEIWVLQALSGG